MNTLSKTLIVLTTLGAANCFAQAVLSTSCPVASKLKLPAGGSGFYMSADCKTAYVLPPAHGDITLEGVMESASLQRCRELDITMKNLREISKRLSGIDSMLDGEVEDSPAPRTGYRPGSPLPTSPRPQPQITQARLTEEEVIRLLEQKKKIGDDIIRNFGQTQGAVVNLLYSSGYGDYVARAREMNNQHKINIMPLPLKNTKFSFTTANLPAESLPITLFASFPMKEEGDVAMNGSVSGTVTLSLLGACPLRNPMTNKLPLFLDTGKFAAALPARLTYQYDLQSTVEYTAKFHRGGLATQIRDSSKRGGVFTSKSVSKLITTSRTDSWFTYEYKCDESRACEQMHSENILDIKKRLMDEVISNITLVKFQNPLTPEAAAEPGTNGAATASGELKKCPHKYCQIGAAVLDVANATFGSSSKVDQYINSESHWDSETASTRKAYSYQGTMGFAPKDN